MANSLPSTGTPNWGVPLNDFITNIVLATANLAEQTITTHQVASDPHGDRAYALSLVTPITSSVNQPNGFLQLSSSGKIPANLVPSGELWETTTSVDVVKDFSAPVAPSLAAAVDCSAQIQAALTTLAGYGGGEVWFGAGYYGVGTTLTVGGGTRLRFAPGAVVVRLTGSSGTVPYYLFSNFTSTSTAGAGSIEFDGGTYTVYTSGATTAGQAIGFGGATGLTVRNATVNGALGIPGITVAAMTDVDIDNVQFTYPAPASGSRSTYAAGAPAVLINPLTSTGLTNVPASMSSGTLANKPCAGVRIASCGITGATASDTYGAFTGINGLAGSTVAVSGAYHTQIAVTGSTAPGFPGDGVTGINWQSAVISANAFSLTDGDPYVQSWSPATAPAYTWIVDSGNSATENPPEWVNMRPCATGFTGTNSGAYPPQYRISTDGTRVELFGTVGVPAANYNGANVFTTALPPALRPVTGYIRMPVVAHDTGVGAFLQVQTSGMLVFSGLPSGSQLVYIDCSYPINGLNGMLES